mmetsp:Transcript_20518/g.57470  ORF Transcript_20518/g.57470 Transcript_20518/m.57470 type:complete len:258 (-) Transcript_20518:11-784(-)
MLCGRHPRHCGEAGQHVVGARPRGLRLVLQYPRRRHGRLVPQRVGGGGAVVVVPELRDAGRLAADARPVHRGQLPLVQEGNLLVLHALLAALVEALEEDLVLAHVAVAVHGALELLEAQLRRVVGVHGLEGQADVAELLGRPLLEVHQRVVRRVVDLLQRDVAAEVLVQGQPGAGDVAVELQSLRRLDELVPGAAVRVVRVHRQPPGAQGVAVLLLHPPDPLLGGVLVGPRHEPGWRPPHVEDLEVLMRQVLLALPV